jgi:hypothetical protein
MPSDDAIWLPGFDGEVACDEKNRFVPFGRSVWEEGTGKGIAEKATEDYEKRSEDKTPKNNSQKTTISLDRSELTFVFATPRIWKDKENWVETRNAERIWKEVLVIDGVDLQDWLESAPSVHLQFAAELGHVPEEGLSTPDEAWEEWSHCTRVPVSSRLVAVGREDQEKELIERLSAPPSTFTIRGDSPREAWAFALAAIRRVSSEEARARLLARTLVVEDEKIAAKLRNLKNLIIILKQAQGQVSGFLSRGSHVVVPEGNDARSRHNVIELPRPTSRPFTEALMDMGLGQEEAERRARECARSVTVLQRRFSHSNFARPVWSDQPTADRLLPALLAGRWNDRSEADRDILCRLSDVIDYETFVERLQEFLTVDEPPIQKIGEMWVVTAPVDAFELMAKRQTKKHLTLFKEAFREVFGRIDPKVDIPPEEWLYHDMKGEGGHSAWLRSGMAESLLLIVEHGPHARLVCTDSPHAYAKEVVRGLPGLGDDWRVLASLRDEYPRLMEATPGPLLDSLERLLEAKPEDVRRLFNEGNDIFAGGGMHTGILWGLETLAWSPRYLTRVALLLAKLATLDPGGRLSNRPINSLREIFLWWHPGTHATTADRLSAIDLILQRELNAGWELIAKLLPDSRASSAHLTAKPRWRDFGDSPKEFQSRHKQLEYASAIVDRALGSVANVPSRWGKVLRALAFFTESQREQVLNRLDLLGAKEHSEDVRSALWETLREFIAEHRISQGSEPNQNSQFLNLLEARLPQFVPDDAVERNRWLFDEYFPDLPSRRESREQHEKKIEKLRRQALGEILAVRGLEGIVALGTACKIPHFVASVAVPLLQDFDALLKLVEHACQLGETGIPLATYLSAEAQSEHGNHWREVLSKRIKTSDWSPSISASLLICWPNRRSTWEAVAALGDEVDAEYWRLKPIQIIDGDQQDQSYQVERLIQAGRSAPTFQSVSFHAEGLTTETLIRLFDATFQEMERVETAEEARRFSVRSSDLQDFLKEMRRREDLPKPEVARREYLALPLLSHLRNSDLILHEFMSEEPQFFVDVLCDAFLPAHRDKSKDVKPTPAAQARAQAGYSLLQGMKRIPGQCEGARLDQEMLLEWIVEVRKLAAERDRAVIADLFIGKVLAQAAPDPDDGSWPHRVVRNVIEAAAAEELDRGLIMERFNMRGVYSKSLYEGGDQERELAEQYRDWAETCRREWPRTAHILDDIVKGWEENAQREDQRAEQRGLEYE